MKSRFRHILSLSVVLLLLVQTLLPFFATYAVSLQGDKSIDSIFGDKILLCTAEGFRLVDISELDEHEGESHEYQCPLCYVAAHYQVIEPVQLASDLVVMALTEQEIVYTTEDKLFPRRLWHKSLTRSPPLSLA